MIADREAGKVDKRKERGGKQAKPRACLGRGSLRRGGHSVQAVTTPPLLRVTEGEGSTEVYLDVARSIGTSLKKHRRTKNSGHLHWTPQGRRHLSEFRMVDTERGRELASGQGCGKNENFGEPVSKTFMRPNKPGRKNFSERSVERRPAMNPRRCCSRAPDEPASGGE